MNDFYKITTIIASEIKDPEMEMLFYYLLRAIEAMVDEKIAEALRDVSVNVKIV